jgi:hypothetical protein
MTDRHSKFYNLSAEDKIAEIRAGNLETVAAASRFVAEDFAGLYPYWNGTIDSAVEQLRSDGIFTDIETYHEIWPMENGFGSETLYEIAFSKVEKQTVGERISYRLPTLAEDMVPLDTIIDSFLMAWNEARQSFATKETQ